MVKRKHIAAICTLSVTAMLLGGCAMQEGEFPTLATRNVETYYDSGEADAPRNTPKAGLNSAIAAKVQDMRAKAEAGQRAFTAAYPAARQSALNARGAATGSESWAVATTRISALDASRNDSATVLADLDQLYSEQVTGETDSPATAAAINDARQSVYDMVQKQNSEIGALRAMIGG